MVCNYLLLAGGLFILLIVSFIMQKLFSLRRLSCLFLLLFPLPEGREYPKEYPKEYIAKTDVKECTAYISFRKFMVSGHTFKFLIHFESQFDFFTCSCIVFLTFIEVVGFPPVACFYFLCHRLIAHVSVGSILVSLFHSIHLCVYFCASTLLFWLL